MVTVEAMMSTITTATTPPTIAVVLLKLSGVGGREVVIATTLPLPPGPTGAIQLLLGYLLRSIDM